jgi:hypothetical protein
MKLNTVRKYNFTASYRGYDVFVDPDTEAEQRTYADPVEIKCWIVNNALGQLSLHTKSKLQNDGGIGFLRTKNGELVYPIGTTSGAVWRIIEGMPMLDSFGNIYEYKYRCQMIVPKLGSVTEAAPSLFINGSWTID